MIIQKKVSNSNTKLRSSSQSKSEVDSDSMKLKLYNYYLFLKLSWTLFALKCRASFLPKSHLVAPIKHMVDPFPTSWKTSIPEVASKSPKGSSRRVGSRASSQKKAASLSTKQRSKASTSQKRKPSLNT